MKRLLPHPLLAVFIILVWLLLVNSAAPGPLVFAVVLALILVPLTTRFWTESPSFRRTRVLLRLVPMVLWDILMANLAVAWITLTRTGRSLQPAFLEIPLRIQDPYAVVSLASIITLTPGTVSVLLSEDRRTLYVHALDCPDVEGTIQDIRDRYETPLEELLG